MEFVSISQYFYKMYNTVMFILLIPLITFTALYLMPHEGIPIAIAAYSDLFITCGCAVMILWLAMFFFFNKKIKTVRNDQGLRRKLEKYFELTIVRYILIVISTFVLAAGFYLTRNDIFTLTFLGHLVIAALLWPRTSKVTRDLRLRGDEREMVFFKKDIL
jgi:hypothetical protein